MIQFGKQYCYKLIRYFNKYKQDILDSIIRRKIMDEQEANRLLDEISNDINKLKELEGKKNTKSDTGEHNIKLQINELYCQIGHTILKLPNRLDKDVVEQDIVLDEHTRNTNHKHGVLSFTDYLNKYTIRSNGRVIFMDNTLALLFNQLQNFLINYNCQHGFNFLVGNDIAEDKYMYIAGQLPNLRPFLYQIEENLFCSPTGEVTILEYVVKNWAQIMQDVAKQNIIFYSTYTSCYRNEDAGHSSFNKPLIRQSVFHKVETFAVSNLELEIDGLNKLLRNALEILNKLNINYRVIKVGSIEMSKSAYIQYDIELYLPISQKYVEISSCSTCNTFQLNRDCINTDKEYQDQYCTLNCSALPLERLIAAIIEYYWDETSKKFNIEF